MEKIPKKIKSNPHYTHNAAVCNEWWGPSPQLSAWVKQLQRNVTAVASRWRHSVDLTSPGIEPQTSCTDSVRLAQGCPTCSPLLTQHLMRGCGPLSTHKKMSLKSLFSCLSRRKPFFWSSLKISVKTIGCLSQFRPFFCYTDGFVAQSIF